MTVWFTADSHFGHAGILKHQSQRKFADTDEMDACFIDSINEHVKPNDTLYHLGDFCWQASRAGHYRARLKVRKLHIVRGNHDASSLRKHCSTLEHMMFVKLAGRKFHLCHYPLGTWNAEYKGGYHLHGHSHGLYTGSGRQMDVGFDSIYWWNKEWRPVALEEILERLKNAYVPGGRT